MEQLLKQESKVQIRTHILSTNMKTVYEVNKIAPYLNAHKSIVRWSIDLHDWERVLKVISTGDLDLAEVVYILSLVGLLGKELNN